MELSIISKISMFFSSYTLLFIALAVKNYQNKALWLLLSISILGLVATFFILHTRINPDEASIVQIKTKNELVTGYLVTYILPFLSFNLNSLTELLSLLIILITICVLYIKADLIYINPTLMLMGYNIYDIEMDNGRKRTLLSKKKIQDLKLLSEITFYELHDRMIIIERVVNDE